ncbi:unnamed protein product [Rotaria magnacalcarata]|uniref:Uncharacterized protein n=1 Tax=Rotaria magnacalcarata TaxID=392030 RepID=A0A816T235_9BILA|nr:unnamed protein product [Rotaria magnacalcarata]CAF2230808.1 unnamed protein product [Rotaria magnacalcarata]CAF4127418.1 unnamed protein product [Rotaria magnacalcarata]CAF4131264.1 unnamed protein product [Rotaria magnacalcarata]
MVDSPKEQKLVISRSVIAKKEAKQMFDTSQNFIGVWLDENSEAPDKTNYINLKQYLNNTFDCLKIFTQAWDFITYIDSVKHGRILIILSHKHATNATPIIEEKKLSAIYSMYVFCSNQCEKNIWDSKATEKLRGGFLCKDELMNRLKDDIDFININDETPQCTTRSSSTECTANDRIVNGVPSMSFFNMKQINNSIQHLSKDSIWFIRYQLLFEILYKLEKSKRASEEMIYVCKQHYKDDETEMRPINEFEKDVDNSFESISWYTKVSFIVHLLNKACGSQNIDEIYPFRLFIRNLHEEIAKLDTERREKIPNPISQSTEENILPKVH